jgi:outer membrane protein assembly factor BamD
MKKSGFAFKICFVFFAFLLVFSFGCGKKFEDMSAKEIYEFGSEKFEKGKYSEATEAYEALIDLYPFSVYVSKAELGIADSYFEKRRWDEAIPAYSDFLDRHPTNEKVPHVVYNLGMCYYEKKMAIDRDQIATYEAEANFRRLVTEFPESEYYGNARKKLNEVREDLAKRERYIAKFYFREKEYYASLRRYMRVIRNYPDTKYFEEALYYSALCYVYLGEDQDAKRQVQLLKLKFPDGKYGKKSNKILEKSK